MQYLALPYAAEANSVWIYPHDETFTNHLRAKAADLTMDLICRLDNLRSAAYARGFDWLLRITDPISDGLINVWYAWYQDSAEELNLFLNGAMGLDLLFEDAGLAATVIPRLVDFHATRWFCGHCNQGFTPAESDAGKCPNCTYIIDDYTPSLFLR